MKQTKMSINYIKTKQNGIYFELPYVGLKASMIVYLPSKVTTDFSLECSSVIDQFSLSNFKNDKKKKDR